MEKDREDRKEDRKTQLEFNKNVTESLSAITKSLTKIDTIQVELNNSDHRHNAHDIQFQEQERDIKDLQKEKASSKRVTDLENKVENNTIALSALSSIDKDNRTIKNTVIGGLLLAFLTGGGALFWDSKNKSSENDKLIKAIETMAEAVKSAK